MTERYITLLGAEQVQSAAHSMRGAADDMRHAANTLSEALDRQRSFMDDWLSRFAQILEDHREKA